MKKVQFFSSSSTDEMLLRRVEDLLDRVYPDTNPRNDNKIHQFRENVSLQLSNLQKPLPLDVRSELNKFIRQLEKIASDRNIVVPESPSNSLSNQPNYYFNFKINSENYNAENATQKIRDVNLILGQPVTDFVQQREVSDSEELSQRIRSVLQQKYNAECWIERLTGEPLPIDESFVHVAIVDERNQMEKEERLKQRMSERYGILNTWEDIHKPKIEILMENLFKPINRLHPRRYMVFGRAGIGKSTLCQRIAYLWNQGKLLQEEKFDHVFWIPLRRINSQEFPLPPHGTSLSLADIIRHVCLEDKIKLTLDDLDYLKTNKKILYLLDGFDETSHLGQALYLKTILDKLINEAPYLILTSRPYQTNITHVDQTLEILGFNDEDIQSYVDKVLPESDKKENLKKFLQENPNVKGLNHIPVHLDLICSIWEEDSSDAPFRAPLTMTELYRKMVQHLFNRYFKRKEVNPNQLSDAEKAFKDSVMAILGNIATEAMKSEQLLISAEQIEKIIQLHHKNLTIEDLHAVGLLKSIGKGYLNSRKSYFIHLTFQEYFMAYYLCHAGEKEITFFIKEYRYNFRFQIVLKFLAGLLCLNDDSVTKGKVLFFFKELYQKPHDIVGFHHLLLAAECLDECENTGSLYDTINAQYGLLDNLKQWLIRVISELNKDKRDKYAYIEYLIRFFKNSVQLFMEERILSTFVNWPDKSQAILRLGQIKRANSLILSSLQECFTNNHYRRDAAKAFYGIGASNDTISLLRFGLQDRDQFVRLYCSLALVKYNRENEKEVIDNLLIPFEFPDREFRQEFDLLVELIDELKKSTENVERILTVFVHLWGSYEYYLEYIGLDGDRIGPKLKEAIFIISRQNPKELVTFLLEMIKVENKKNRQDNQKREGLCAVIDVLGEIKGINEDIRCFILEALCKNHNLYVRISSIRALFKMDKVTDTLIQTFISCLDYRDYSFSKEIKKTIEALGNNLNEKMFDLILSKLVNHMQKPTTSSDENEWGHQIIEGLGYVIRLNKQIFDKLVKCLDQSTREDQMIAILVLGYGDPRRSINLLLRKLNSVDLEIQILVITGLIVAGEIKDFLFFQLIDLLQQKQKSGTLAEKIAYWFEMFLDPSVLKSLLTVLKKIPMKNTSIFLSDKAKTLDFGVIIGLIRTLAWSNFQADDMAEFLNKFDLSPWLSGIEFDVLTTATFEDFFPERDREEKKERWTGGIKLAEILAGSPTKNLLQLYFGTLGKNEEQKLVLLLPHIIKKILNDRLIITVEDQTLTVFDGTDPLRIILDSEQKVKRANELKKLLTFQHQNQSIFPSSKVWWESDIEDKNYFPEAEYYFSEAEKFMQERQYKNAIEYLEKAIHLSPSKVKYHILLGHGYLAIFDCKQALMQFEQSQKLENTPDPGTYQHIACAQAELGNYAAALENYTLSLDLIESESLKESYEYWACLNNMWETLFILDEQGKAIVQLEKAFKFIEEANKKNYFYSIIASNLADVYRQVGQLSAAMQYINKAFEAASDYTPTIIDDTPTIIYATICIKYAAILLAQGAYEKALEQLTLAENIFKPHDYQDNWIYRIRLLQGKIFRARKENDLTSQAFEAALTIALKIYKDEHIKVADCYLEMGILKRQQGEEGSAVAWFVKAYEIYKLRLGENNSRTKKAQRLLEGQEIEISQPQIVNAQDDELGAPIKLSLNSQESNTIYNTAGLLLQHSAIYSDNEKTAEMESNSAKAEEIEEEKKPDAPNYSKIGGYKG